MTGSGPSNLADRQPDLPGREKILGAGISILVFAWLAFWILHLYPTLINDEYAALDFVYRALAQHYFTPPPHRFYKPYSLIFGLSAFAGGPRTFELIAAAFAGGLIFVFFRAARMRLRLAFAILATLFLAAAPDLFDNTVQAITIVPATFFIVLALAQGMDLGDRPENWRRYSLAGFLGGLARPESWLLAFPLVYWLRPKKISDLARWFLAPAFIALSAAIWFGKDWFLARDILYSLEVARYDKMIGAGAYFGPAKSLYWFHFFLSQKFSAPFEIICVAGFLLYVWDHRKRLMAEPLVWVTVLLFLFLYLSIWSGLYPQMRFFFPLGVFMIFFAGWLLQRIYDYARTANHRVFGLAMVVVISAGYFVWAGYRQSQFEMKALSRESAIQRQTIELAEYFRPILKDKKYRIMLSERRDDEFSWLLRDEPVQEYIAFREAYYYGLTQSRDFMSYHPDWIVWLDNDYQFKGVNELFQWLNWQDQTELSGNLIKLEKVIGGYRIFRVTKLEPRPNQ